MPSCQEHFNRLVDCLLTSPCVLQDAHTVKECLSPEFKEDKVPNQCRLLQRTYIECKRSLVCMFVSQILYQV